MIFAKMNCDSIKDPICDMRGLCLAMGLLRKETHDKTKAGKHCDDANYMKIPLCVTEDFLGFLQPKHPFDCECRLSQVWSSNIGKSM